MENEKAKLYMIGTGKKEYLERCFLHIKELGLEDKIVWQDKMEQKFLSRIYQMADFFLLPTEYEIFGMVLLEAMYYKTVVLTTQNGGSSTLIQNGLNGYIMQIENGWEWANTILSISNDERKMKKIQDNASSTIGKFYTWDMLSESFLTQYNQLREKL